MKFSRKEMKEDHEQVEERLDDQEKKMKEMARRVRVLELQAGIYKNIDRREVQDR